MVIMILLIIVTIIALIQFLTKLTAGWFLLTIFSCILLLTLGFAQSYLPKSVYRCDVATYSLQPIVDDTYYYISNDNYILFSTSNEELKAPLKDTRLLTYSNYPPQLVEYNQKLNKNWYIIFAIPPSYSTFYDLHVPSQL